jgi:hypothetical protein
MKYQVVTADDLDVLAAKVETLMAENWGTIGGIAVIYPPDHGPFFYQAMEYPSV